MTFLHEQIDQKLEQEKNWALRRQLGIPNNKRLWVLACMDERLPIEKVLGLSEGDAHIFRNAGGLVTDDAIRSAMLTTQFFGTREIIVVTHTECGMMTASGDLLAQILKDRGIKVDEVEIDPALPELKLPKGIFSTWIKTFTDVDAITIKQVELLRNSPLIPDDVVIHGYVWEVETQRLRRPYERLSDKVNTALEMGTKSPSDLLSEVH
ncbi:beta-class carbonic anhydrase [Gloeothece verrucosa]|uniref:carbonic anhydrase n=1 Tax=Gloeothece verrucosa (strain PCC 7822) TaxID=497965 RepID=E0UFL0_GLOV7|nr:carbonic anhydrase [Gloeothece verrucosa]ADN13121.1 carbonic anhydrase [Gloeothece verrucosa PCC 7822]